jgi:hypothetical protein
MNYYWVRKMAGKFFYKRKRFYYFVNSFLDHLIVLSSSNGRWTCLYYLRIAFCDGIFYKKDAETSEGRIDDVGT